MGYFLNVLKQGEIYELDGQRLQFIEKIGKWFYFYVCKMDEWSFKYEPTKEKLEFTVQEINFIKRVCENTKDNGLRMIGRDKVFQRY